MTTPTPPLFTTPERLCQVVVETLVVSAQELQAAIGQLVVATTAEHPSAGPDDRSLHDAAAGVTVLLADRIHAGQEAQVLAMEIGRHHGRQAAQLVLGDQAAELLGGDGKPSNYTRLTQDVLNALASKHHMMPGSISVSSDGVKSVVLERDDVDGRYCQAILTVQKDGSVTCHTGLYRERAIINCGSVSEPSVEAAIANASAAFGELMAAQTERKLLNDFEQLSLPKENAQSHERAVAQWKDFMARKVPCVIYPGGMGAPNKFIVAPAEAPKWWLGDYASLEGAQKFCSKNGLNYEIHEVRPRACISKPSDEYPSPGM